MSAARKTAKIEMPGISASRRITGAAKSNPDAKPLTDSQPKAMVPLRSVRGPGKPESKKLLISIRYSHEVVACFKSTGEGWQARMDGVLKQYVQRHSRQP